MNRMKHGKKNQNSFYWLEAKIYSRVCPNLKQRLKHNLRLNLVNVWKLQKILLLHTIHDTFFFIIILKIKLLSPMKTLFHFDLCNLLIPLSVFFVLAWKSHTLRRLIFKGIQIWPYFACIFKIWNCTNTQLRKNFADRRITTNFAEKHFRGFFKLILIWEALKQILFYLCQKRI